MAEVKLSGKSVAGITLLVALVLVDLIVLDGDRIYSKWGIRLDHDEPTVLIIPIDRLEEKHSIRFNTKKRKLAISWVLEDPNGFEIASDTEYTRHEGSRRESFVPMVAGEYMLKLDLESGVSILGNSSRDRVDVKVVVGDRQILSPIFELFD